MYLNKCLSKKSRFRLFEEGLDALWGALVWTRPYGNVAGCCHPPTRPLAHMGRGSRRLRDTLAPLKQLRLELPRPQAARRTGTGHRDWPSACGPCAPIKAALDCL